MAIRKAYAMATAQVATPDLNEDLAAAIGVAVRKAIMAGWQPVGGVSAFGRNAYQAVMKTIDFDPGAGGPPPSPPVFTP